MKKTTEKITAMLCAVMMIAGAGCSNGNQNASGTTTTTTAGTTTAASSDTQTSETTKESEKTEDTSADTTEKETNSPSAAVKAAALKGPTAMGMIKMIADSDKNADSNYEFEIYASPDELTPLLIQGTVDIACIPANLASVLYNKTGGEIEVLAINTLGVIYIVENGTEEIKSVSDLKGKTVYASGQGSTPEFALNYILEQNGIKDEVNIEWKTEHAECLTAINENPGGIAMLPQPFVTTAQMKNDGIRVALSLSDEWDKLDNGSMMITGVVVGRKEFVENRNEDLSAFLSEYVESVSFVNTEIDEAAALIGQYDIVPEAVAKKAIPACNIVYFSGEDMKEPLSGYLKVLYDSLPGSVGGNLPGDDFYYIAD